MEPYVKGFLTLVTLEGKSFKNGLQVVVTMSLFMRSIGVCVCDLFFLAIIPNLTQALPIIIPFVLWMSQV